MKSLAALAFAGMVVAVSSGCATYVAMKMPGPSRDEEVAIGMHRLEVERTLGVGAASQYKNNGMIRYEYADGPPQGTKVRSVLYVAGDVFTAFLSELIFWPAELHADKTIRRVGTAEYDHENRLANWSIHRVSGESLKRDTPPALEF